MYGENIQSIERERETHQRRGKVILSVWLVPLRWLLSRALGLAHPQSAIAIAATATATCLWRQCVSQLITI